MRLMNMHGVFHKYTQERKVGWVRVVEGIITFILLLAFAGFIYENIFSRIEKEQFKLKGKMIDMGGYRVFTRSTGEGKATVVMESDIGDPSLQWNKVVEPVSKNARVIAYDRAGYGWSDSGPAPRTIETEVKELKALLRKSSAKTPYILIGHGYGGLIMMRYAKEFPDDVGALILLDTPSESYMKTPEFQSRLDKNLKLAKLYRYGAFFGLVRITQELDKLPVNQKVMDNLNEEGKTLYRAHRVTIKHNKALYDELSEYKDYEGGTQVKDLMGEKPVYILSSTKSGLSSKAQETWMESQKELLELSTKSEHIAVEDSGYYFHLDRAEVIANTVNAILKKIVK